MKIFRGLPAPSYDETFSSWMYRCSLSGNIHISAARGSIQACPKWWWSGRRIESEDPDFDLKSDFVISAIEALGLNPQIIHEYFNKPSRSVVRWDMRNLFCPDCLRDDIRCRRLPSWKSNWCYIDSIICWQHGCELVRLGDRPRCSKAWDAFTQICSTKVGADKWSDDCFVRLRKVLLSNIHNWLSSEISASEGQQTPSELFSSLYSVFLQSPYRGTRGGVVRSIFQSRNDPKANNANSLEDSIIYGAETCGARSRFGACVLSAILLDAIPCSTIAVLTKYYEKANVYWSFTESQLGSLYFPNVDVAGYKFLHSYFGRFPRRRWPLLDFFLSKQEERYRRDGVFIEKLFGEQ